ncbi:MAG: hypothetical protein ACXQS2_01510 [Methermicoccaceae archaeon]
MVKEETKKFYEENKELIEFVIEHGSPEVKKIAMAIKLAVKMDEKKRMGGDSV